MRTIRDIKTLLYYDGVQVFEARDLIGGHYVGVMIGTKDSTDRYLVAGATPEALRRFRLGKLDLRSLLLESPDDEWYLTQVMDDFEQPLPLEKQNVGLANADFLPAPGFVLSEPPSDDWVLQEAHGRHNTIFEFNADPPEAASEHRIKAATLGGLLLHVQTLVTHAYRRAIRDLPDQARRMLDSADGGLMDVLIPAAPGSFRVVLEAVGPTDMFGNGELARGLRRMDEVFESASNPKTAKEQLNSHKGHLVGSYITLMRFLNETNSNFQYSWAEPASNSAHHGGISEVNARELVTLLADVTSLGIESVTFVGKLERAQRDTGNWTLVTEDSRRTGTTAERGPSLNGLQIGKEYTFDCEEHLEVAASGRETRTYYVRTIS